MRLSPSFSAQHGAQLPEAPGAGLDRSFFHLTHQIQQETLSMRSRGPHPTSLMLERVVLAPPLRAAGLDDAPAWCCAKRTRTGLRNRALPEPTLSRLKAILQTDPDPRASPYSLAEVWQQGRKRAWAGRARERGNFCKTNSCPPKLALSSFLDLLSVVSYLRDTPGARSEQHTCVDGQHFFHLATEDRSRKSAVVALALLSAAPPSPLLPPRGHPQKN